jgi:hypothetical protein
MITKHKKLKKIIFRKINLHNVSPVVPVRWPSKVCTIVGKVFCSSKRGLFAKTTLVAKAHGSGTLLVAGLEQKVLDVCPPLAFGYTRPAPGLGYVSRV